MSTLRKLVSGTRGTHRLLSTDNMMSDRLIASEVVRTSLLLVKRETNIRKLWSSDTLFTTIPCLDMINVPITECAAFNDDLEISRSKHKIPTIAEGNYQYVIQGVYSINVLGGTGSKLKEITINRYLNLLNLPARKNEVYFWINDDYLYVSTASVKSVRITALFNESIPNSVMYPEDCACCSDNFTTEDYCMNPLDREFFLPGYLEAQVLGMVSKTLLGTYFAVQQDVTSEGIDGQAANSTPTN